jgi:uncharacterized protein (DUF302 family)
LSWRQTAQSAKFASRYPNKEVRVFYIVESSKSFYEATFDLEPVVQRLGFVVLKVHHLGEARHGKAIELDDECQVFEVSNDRLTGKLLAIDMRLSLGLPWRISVFTENGATKIGLLRPGCLLAGFAQTAELARLMQEIEEKLVQIVDEAR